MTSQNRAALGLLRTALIVLTGGLAYLLTRSGRVVAAPRHAQLPAETPLPVAVTATIAETAPERIAVATGAASVPASTGFDEDDFDFDFDLDERVSGLILPDEPRVAPAAARAVVAEAERVLETEGPKRAAALGRLLRARLGLMWLAFVAGGVVISYAFALADRGHTHAEFTVFWIGVLLFMLPACSRIAQRHTPRWERLALISATGAFEFLPKLIRNPSGPLFADEFAHYRQTDALRVTGKLFAENPLITVIHHFPGLDIVVSSLGGMSGLSTWTIAELLLGTAHVLALVGVFLIAERVGRSPMIGGIAAVIYAISPNYMFFNSQYSYESLAIVLVIWTLVCVVIAHDEDRSAQSRRAWLGIAALIGLSCVPTHHLSSYFLAALIGVLALLGSVRRGGTPVAAITKELWVLCASLALAAFAWAVLVAPDVTGYLSAPLEGAFQAVGGLLSQHGSQHTLFKGSQAPGYEQIFGFVSVPIAIGAMLAGLFMIWRRRDLRPIMLTFGLLALGYVASLALVATAAGSETGRRSWAFAYLGIGVIGAFGVAAVMLGRRRRLAVVALTGAFVVAMIGNVSVDLNVAYRFPGAYVYGSDTRSITPEVLAASAWLKQQEGSGQRVIADRYLSNALGGLDGAFTPNASPGFPIWQLYTTAGHPSVSLMYELESSHWNYLVVDKRMALSLPEVGVYFTSAEPRHLRVTEADLAALGDVPWLSRVWDSRNLEIFRFNFAQFFDAQEAAR